MRWRDVDGRPVIWPSQDRPVRRVVDPMVSKSLFDRPEPGTVCGLGTDRLPSTSRSAFTGANTVA